jgi:hypothetical protein
MESDHSLPASPSLRKECLPQSDRAPIKPSRELEAAGRISETLFQHLEVDDLVELTLSAALQEVDAEAGSILLVDRDAQQLVFYHSIGIAPVSRRTVIGWIRVLRERSFNQRHRLSSAMSNKANIVSPVLMQSLVT